MLNKLLNINHIILDSKAKTQLEAFQELSLLAKKLNLINDEESLISGFIDREKIGTTGFENGIAIPHAQTDKILSPAVLIIRFENEIDWKSVDNSKVKIAIAIILPKNKVEEMHIEILKNVSLKLLDKNFVDEIKRTNSKEWIINNWTNNIKNNSDDSNNENKKQKLIVGVSACTTGVAHTYMCKEILEKKGKEMGYDIRIECQGQRGREYNLTDEEIAKAEVVILAIDIGIDMEIFAGKKIFTCSTNDVVKDPTKVINNAIQISNSSNTKNKNGKITSENQVDFIQAAGKGKPQILKHLLSGCSYLIPFVVFAGLSFSIITGIAKATYGSQFTFGSAWGDWTTKIDPNGNNFNDLRGWGASHTYTLYGFAHTLFYLNNISNLGFNFMIPILAAYIGYSICGRSALVSCFITAYVLINPSDSWWFNWNGIFNVTPPSQTSLINIHDAGFGWSLVGGIYAGFVGGYITKGLLKIRVVSWFAPVMPIIIIPVCSTLLAAVPVAFILAAPFGWIMGRIDSGMSYLATSNSSIIITLKFFIGALVGAMIGFDLGGPINKIAVLTATSLIGQQISNGSDGGALMGAAGAAIPIAPMGSGLCAVLFGRKMFTKQEKVGGYNALLLGFMGISESGIPFLVKDTWRNMIPNLIGSAIAGGLAYVFGCADRVGAYGSFIVGLLGGVASPNNGTNIFIVTGLFFLAMIIGIIIHAILYTILLLQKNGKLFVIFNKTKSIFFKNKKEDINIIK